MGFGKWVKQRFAKPHKPSNVKFGQKLTIGAAAVGGALLIPGVGGAVVHGAASTAGAVGRGALAVGKGVVGAGKIVTKPVVGAGKLIFGRGRKPTATEPSVQDYGGLNDLAPMNDPNTNRGGSFFDVLKDALSSEPGALNRHGMPEPGGYPLPPRDSYVSPVGTVEVGQPSALAITPVLLIVGLAIMFAFARGK